MNAVRISSTAFGLLCSLTGIIAGVYLILQGNTPTETWKISYIGPSFFMWEHDAYRAYTLIPNYLITGLVTLLISIVLLNWSLFLIHKSYGSLGFLMLSMGQLLTGGGFVIDLALLTFLLSFGIKRNLHGWEPIFRNKFGYYLVRIWYPMLWIYTVLSFVLLFLTMAGANHPGVLHPMAILAMLMFIPILVLAVGSLACKVRKSGG